ncbi:prepilin peptidase [Actinacidiphila acididurans]|uniref:Prepilin peptidase n=1 Tax=Actinacidiphila acididurans TaxID=2784346 RepID=A0ABS2TMA8_9ACTN|nr:A24 family peptidase [Actinacidiphila acididurans]MBM9504475.1 prepilin peptidase [Actinacidiphila acididurans]
MHVYLIAGAAVWGFAAGLLLVPRAAYRLAVPPEEPWAAACPAGHPIRGWLGPSRCPACTQAPPAYDAWYAPTRATALAAALASGALAYEVGPHPELAVWLLLVPVGIVLARVDLVEFRLPDVLTLPALVGTAALLGLAALLPAHHGSWPRALLVALATGAFYLVLHLFNPAGLGLGDVKLAPTLGLALGWYGWPAAFLGTFAALALGALAGLALLLTGRSTRTTPYPFGPFLLLGALTALLHAART